MIKALFISYNGAAEHLSHSQVIPYLKELSKKGVRVTLLSYEKPSALKKKALIRELKSELAGMGIEWHHLTYHKNPGLLAKLFDIGLGIIYSLYLVKTRSVNLIHGRSTIPAAIAFVVSGLSRTKYIFDMRGLLAEEYADAGAWKRGSLKYRLVNRAEKKLLASADSVVVLTNRIRAILTVDRKYFPNPKDAVISVIPCCVDLNKFYVRPTKDLELLNELNLSKKFIFGYVGSLGTWYMLDEMVDFFVIAKGLLPNAHFMILTQSEKEYAEMVIRKKGLDKNDYTITEQPPHNVPRFLSLLDAGIFFIKPSFSKQASSPTKLAEFLACGVPIIINSGVGDTGEIVKNEGIGVVNMEFSDTAYHKAVEELKELLLKGLALKRRCRETAEKYFSLEYGSRKYKEIYESLLKT